MLGLWIAAALVSAAAAALIVHRAARAAHAVGGEDPALAVYRRQLAEIDDLAERGLLPETERRAAHAEAGRRLLSAADAAEPKLMATQGGRRAIAVVAALAPLAAVGVYLVVGSPQIPDQPFARRLAEWRAADPRSLGPDQMAAVLQLIVAEHPADPRARFFLSRAQLASGDSFGAISSLRRALTLAPRQVDLWAALGEAYLSDAGGEVSSDANKAFQQALQIDPHAPGPRYYLARAKIAGGDVAGGVAAWRALDEDLPTADPRRTGLEQEIAEVDRTHALPLADQAAAAPSPQGQQAFIRAMVDTLAARLTASPDDPAGWARLIRSYAVLGDDAGRRAALARAQALFKDRPNDLRLVQSAALSPQ
jgi:cytochrome c-type biogenesis protein CcmH